MFSLQIVTKSEYQHFSQENKVLKRFDLAWQDYISSEHDQGTATVHCSSSAKSEAMVHRRR